MFVGTTTLKQFAIRLEIDFTSYLYLKRSSVPEYELNHLYKSVVRPVLEDACTIWLTNLTKDSENA